MDFTPCFVERFSFRRTEDFDEEDCLATTDEALVRVQDEETLRKQNTFYKDVREGEYILIYKNLAIIYDLRNNIVVGVKRD
jgi:hypothetical protein